MSEWWTGSQGAYVGAIGGSLIGVFGAIAGCTIGYCVPKGKCRSLAVGMLASMLALGLALLAAGIAAVVLKQPYHVWYPMVLGGSILSMVCGINLPIVVARYRQVEARRLDAEALRRS